MPDWTGYQSIKQLFLHSSMWSASKPRNNDFIFLPLFVKVLDRPKYLIWTILHILLPSFSPCYKPTSHQRNPIKCPQARFTNPVNEKPRATLACSTTGRIHYPRKWPRVSCMQDIPYWSTRQEIHSVSMDKCFHPHHPFSMATWFQLQLG